MSPVVGHAERLVSPDCPSRDFMILAKIPVAPSDTLLGRLQRGTGAGYLDALAADRSCARDALAAAVRLDWRWDRQLDSRTWYYAQLATHLGFSSGDIEALILSTVDHDPDDLADAVAVGVLCQLACFGDASAATRLIEYVRYGLSLEGPMLWCSDHGSDTDVDLLYRALDSRIPSRAALARDTAFDDLGWLRHLLEMLTVRDDRFQRFVRMVDSIERRPAREWHDEAPATQDVLTPGMTFEEGCRAFLAASRLHGRDYRDAMAWLARQFAPSHADFLVECIFSEHADRSVPRLADLAPLLPVESWADVTRRALADGRAGPRRAAVGLLTRSTRPDPELVRLCLRSAVARNDMYPACDMLDIVARDGMSQLVPDVEVAYHDVTYSFYARRKAVEILVRLAPSRFREQYARECLWDSEPVIMEIGCRHVDLDGLDVRPRLEFLRDACEPGPDEEPATIHRLARERLGY